MDEKKIKGTCFVISPIGSEGSETRKRSDQILRHILEPVAASCDYETLRADKISKSGSITSQVIQHLIDDPVVIADLTDHNANVFYELAIRHTVRKPYVQIIHKSQALPFDVSGIRTIPFDHQDLDSVEQFKKELADAIRAVEGKTDVESPFSVAVDVGQLRNSADPEKRQLADLSYGLSEVKGILNTLVSAMQHSVKYPYFAALQSNRNAPASPVMNALSAYADYRDAIYPYVTPGPAGAAFLDDEDTVAPPPIPDGVTGYPPRTP